MKELLDTVPVMQNFIKSVIELTYAGPDDGRSSTHIPPWQTTQTRVLREIELMHAREEELRSQIGQFADLETALVGALRGFNPDPGAAAEAPNTVDTVTARIRNLAASHANLERQMQRWSTAEAILDTAQANDASVVAAHVKLFQGLFDVRSVSGVAQAMTAVHNRLSEFTTALFAIGSAVGQPLERGTAAIVRRVERLANATIDSQSPSKQRTPFQRRPLTLTTPSATGAPPAAQQRSEILPPRSEIPPPPSFCDSPQPHHPLSY